MGMMDSSYWMSWHVYHLAISFVSSLILCAFPGTRPTRLHAAAATRCFFSGARKPCAH